MKYVIIVAVRISRCGYNKCSYKTKQYVWSFGKDYQKVLADYGNHIMYQNLSIINEFILGLITFSCYKLSTVTGALWFRNVYEHKCIFDLLVLLNISVSLILSDLWQKKVVRNDTYKNNDMHMLK